MFDEIKNFDDFLGLEIEEKIEFVNSNNKMIKSNLMKKKDFKNKYGFYFDGEMVKWMRENGFRIKNEKWVYIKLKDGDGMKELRQDELNNNKKAELFDKITLTNKMEKNAGMHIRASEEFIDSWKQFVRNAGFANITDLTIIALMDYMERNKLNHNSNQV